MIGIYCRISKQKEKGKDVSIIVQKERGINFAKSKGMEFRVYVDEGISGTKNNISDRPEFALLLNSIKNGEISIVYCIDQSRIERNNTIWNLFVSIMLDAGCKYYPNGKYLDLDVPENRLFTGIMSITNEFYAAITGAKVRDAIHINAQKGKTHGLTAYGYGKDENGYFKIIDEEADIIQRIYEMSLDGIGTYTIANILNEEGVPPKFGRYDGQIKRIDKYTKEITTYNKKDTKWRGNVIHDIIRNPIYKGERKWNDGTVKVPAILTVEYWEKVNKNLENNKKKVGKREEYHYLLNGLIFCESCGSEFRGKKRLKGRDKAYKCKGKSKYKSHISCNSRGISIPKLETFIIKHLFISKELQNHLCGLQENKTETNALQIRIDNTKRALEKNHKVVKKIYGLLIDPDLADDLTLKDELKLVKRKIIQQEEKIEYLENQIIERDSSIRNRRLKNTFGQYKLTSGFTDTKRLVHSLISRISIQHNFNADTKGGYYLIKIEYRGFDESSMFMTDWQATKWYPMGYYRAQANTQKELEDDIDLFKHISKEKGKKIVIPKGFQGFETRGSGLMIELEKNEIIHFD